MIKINNEELKLLFINLKKDDKNSFQDLYLKYSKLVYSIAFSILKNETDAEDIVQIVFTKICYLDKDKLPTSKEACWLYSLTKNESISYMRKNYHEIDIASIYEVEDNRNLLDSVIDKEKYNSLISKLNDKEKQIVSLKVLGNFSFKEISILLNEPSGTVKWRYYKSVHTIRLLLSNLGMFIVTFIIGLKELTNKKVQNQVVENTTLPSTQDKEEIKEDASNLLQDEVDRENVTNSMQENLNDKENIIEETIQDDDIYNLNYFELGIFSISAIFLIGTIIFIIILTKHQLNRYRKTSK